MTQLVVSVKHVTDFALWFKTKNLCSTTTMSKTVLIMCSWSLMKLPV